MDERFFTGTMYDNFGIVYAVGTGVFTIQGANGRALSTSNPGIIVLPTNGTPGEYTRHLVTANQSFIDDNGASEIITNLFGLTTAVAYGEDLPFFIYAVTSDNNDDIRFMISRVHFLVQSPSTSEIGAPDDAVADEQGSFFSFDNLAEGSYNLNPCLMIGSFRMQFSALDDWTVQTLDDRDGIGLFQYDRDFTFPLAVQGASAGTYMLPNSQTAPVFTTNVFTWQILPGGFVSVKFQLQDDGGANGTGAVILYMTLPYNPNPNLATLNAFGSYVRNANSGGTASGVCGISGTFPKACFFRRNDSINFILMSNYSNGARYIHGSGIYKPDTTP